MTPVLHTKQRPREFLYVPEEEVEEAISLGAALVPGDARMVQPRPVPAGIDVEAYGRWKTSQAKYRWCMQIFARVLGDITPGKKVLRESLDEISNGIREAGEGDRVYLYATSSDFAELRDEPYVQWDRRRRMYYATSEADLTRLFRYLTPTAHSAWISEAKLKRALTVLTQERARAVFANRTGVYAAGGSSGALEQKLASSDEMVVVPQVSESLDAGDPSGIAPATEIGPAAEIGDLMEGGLLGANEVATGRNEVKFSDD